MSGDYFDPILLNTTWTFTNNVIEPPITTWPASTEVYLSEDEDRANEPDPLHYGLEGEFQGAWVTADNIRLGESPIEAAVRAALVLGPEDRLVSYLVQTKDGKLELRSWEDR